jgi:hypothetical protein
MNPGFKVEDLQRAVDAVAAHGNVGAASRALGLADATLRERYKAAVKRGFEAQNQPLLVGERAAAPEGYMLKGTSTYYNKDGEAAGQWVKTARDMEQLAALQKAALLAMCEELRPLPPVKLLTHGLDKRLLNLFTLTDCHVGMLAWDKESGEDWDLGIAERCLVENLARLIAAAPEAEVGLLNQLGDFLHFDSLTPMTPTSKHILDADSRYQKVVAVAVRVLRRAIDLMLAKHKRVHVKIMEGNHDPAGSVWLRVMFQHLYEKNPRVSIDASPNPYTIHLHGHTLLGFHHGHLSKKGKLPEVFAQQFRKEWGQSTHTYIHVGHLHHTHEIESAGANVIQHPTLATKDAYAARYGFLSKRQLTAMTYDKTDGEVSRNIVVPK